MIYFFCEFTERMLHQRFFARIWNAIKSFFGFGSDTNNGKPTEPGMNGEIYYEGGGGKLP